MKSAPFVQANITVNTILFNIYIIYYIILKTWCGQKRSLYVAIRYGMSGKFPPFSLSKSAPFIPALFIIQKSIFMPFPWQQVSFVHGFNTTDQAHFWAYSSFHIPLILQTYS